MTLRVKAVTITITILVLAAGIALFTIAVKRAIPTERSLSKSAELPHYDILQWQFDRELEILTDYQAGQYTMASPYIVVDPYQMNPCSALVIFEAPQAGGAIKITVIGDDEYATIRYSKVSAGTHHEIPVIGLYAGRDNLVLLEDELGNTAELIIRTEPLPVDFQDYRLEKSYPEKMEPGLTLFTACFENTYSAILDHNAQVRGYLSNRYMAHGTTMLILENGKVLSTGDEYKQIPYNMLSLWEYNWLGKIFREYKTVNAIHHDISELPGGNILAVSNHRDMFNTGTREDVVIIIDRTTGEVIREYDFRNILDEKREPYHHFHPDIINPANIDWMHANAALYNPADNTIIVSSPTQSQVVAIDADTEEIRWLLGPHEGYETTAAFLRDYLLEPVGPGFEWHWGQHAPLLVEPDETKPGVINLMLFDNGQSRSFYEAESVLPLDNYSRGVHYHINLLDKTVSQVWQYGKECGSACYATFLGDIDYLPQSGNRLITFGGQIIADGKPADEIIAGVFGNLAVRSKVVEVTEMGEVVYAVSAWESSYTNTAETYQAERIELYRAEAYDYLVGEINGQRLGQVYTNPPTNLIEAPLFFGGDLEVSFIRLYVEENRLIADGSFTVEGKSYPLGRAIFVLRSLENTYLFAATSGLNSRFFMSLDLDELESGVYQLSIAAAVLESNDQGSDIFKQGHAATGYKITVP